MFSNPLTQRLAGFVSGIGIDVKAGAVPEKTFLPGLDIQHGAIVVDEALLAHPGDILHEAGHLAVSEPNARNAPTLAPTDAEEIATLAWSYAALTYLDLEPEVVFHADGYNGGSKALIDAFAGDVSGCTIGVPLLQFYGLTVEPKFAAERGVDPFPHMLRWLRA